MFKFKTNRKKFKKLIFRLLFVVFAIWLVFNLVGVQTSISKKSQELNALKEKVKTQAQKNELLQRQLDFGITDEYIAKVAREKLNLLFPLERVFIDVTKE